MVTHYFDNKDGSSVLWHREKDGDFPAMKVLKQLVRDKIDPEIYLGHSDTEERNVGATSGKDEEPSANDISAAGEKLLPKVLEEVPKPNVAIKYCTGCRWMLRSAYLATELLTTFDTEIKSVTLVPSRPPEQGGIFVSRNSYLNACYNTSYLVSSKNL